MSKEEQPGRSPSDSVVKMTQLVLPSHTNALGTIFGGTVMSWIDIAAAISAMKHARKQVVTASIDALNFFHPICLGEVVHIRSQVNFASRTSMEVGVRVDAENMKTGDITRTTQAYTTFVALNDRGKPTPVAPVLPESEDEKRRFEEAAIRRQTRIQLAQELKKVL